MKRIHFICLALVMIILTACSGSANSPAGPGASPDNPAGAANDQGAGPKTLDLTDPALAKQAASSISTDAQSIYESVDKAGAPLKAILADIHMEQIEPQWAGYIHTFTSWNGKVDPETEIESGQLNGKTFSTKKGNCTVSADKNTHKPGGNFFIKLQDLEGKANRVEAGVVINGVLTDRYELKFDNLRWKSHVKEVKSGSLYRAREGGYLVRFEYVVTMDADPSAVLQKQFDPSKPVQFTNRYDLTYYQSGETFVKLPEVCTGK